MLNTDFLKWLVVAFVIAGPVSWYVMHRWLESFVHKTELSWWIFVLTACLVLSMAFIAVNWQTIRVAWRNPVAALRNE